uniref:noelin-3-like n=1 Tax=Styela clava TaxID=7725 RepID=UPI00193943BF|nr:noelin-3-like [Styela clava]
MRSRLQLLLALLANFVLAAYFTTRRHQLANQFASITRDVEVLERSNRQLEGELRFAAETESEVLESLKDNYARLKDLTEYTKSNTLRIKGIEEKDGENLEEKITELAEYMGIKLLPNDINRVNRVRLKTAKNTSAPRVIALELSNNKLKTRLLRQSITSLNNSPYSMQDDVTNHMMPDAFKPVENTRFTKGCEFISSVKEPVTRGQAKKMFGAFLQDPIPSPDGIRDTYVWLLPHFYENNVVEEYANVHEMSFKRSRTTYKVPYEWAGTGHVVYNGSLYFVVFNSTKMVRYEFATRSVLRERKLPGAVSGNVAPYQWSGSTDIDFSTDESGIWVIYATNDNTLDIVLSKIHQETLEVLKTWKTNWRKRWSGNAFMVCGVLYVLRKYDEHHTSLSYVYDTRTKRYNRTDIAFSNKYEWNTMLEYNFRTEQIYAWDRGYLVTYNITLAAQLS